MSRKWTDNDLSFLQESLGKKSLSVMAKQLNRSETAVLMKLKKMGLGNTKKATGLLTTRELANALQVDGKTVHHWIQHHSLEAKSRVTSYKRKFYLIDVHAFWEWAKQNQEKIDFTCIEKNVLPPEPDWVEKARKSNMETQRKTYNRWTTKEIKLLFKWKKEGADFNKIAEKLNRSRISVERCYARYRKMEKHVV